jgi:peptide deformylase
MRYNHIVLKNGLSGSPMVLEGPLAILAQHQIDHLQGVVFYDRVIKLAEVRQSGRLSTKSRCPCGSGKKFLQCCMMKA